MSVCFFLVYGLFLEAKTAAHITGRQCTVPWALLLEALACNTLAELSEKSNQLAHLFKGRMYMTFALRG